MLKSHLKSIFRSLFRRRLRTVLNLLGLSAGMAVCLVIGLYILHELDFDRFHAEADRIFRLVNETDFYGKKTIARTSELAGPKLGADYPEVEMVVRPGSCGMSEARRGRIAGTSRP